MKAVRSNKPSPPNVFGGEGWVRGLRQVVLQRRPVLMRLPLTPAHSTDDKAAGGEGVFLLASEDCSQ